MCLVTTLTDLTARHRQSRETLPGSWLAAINLNNGLKKSLTGRVTGYAEPTFGKAVVVCFDEMGASSSTRIRPMPREPAALVAVFQTKYAPILVSLGTQISFCQD
jgi:hypothetical protein